MATGDSLIQFPTAATVTCTLTSLADATGARESTVINNSSTKYDDGTLSVITKGLAGSTGELEIWGYSSVDKGTETYTDGATGADAAFTAANIKNCAYIGSVKMNGTTAVQWGARYIAQAFGGRLPAYFGFIFKNSSGAALSATAGDHVIEFQGSYYNLAA